MKEKQTKSTQESRTTTKYTYEQLEGICNQLLEQNKNLAKQLQATSMANIFKRLDYLFKVLEYSDKFTNKEFIDNCIKEVEDTITLPAEDTEKEG